ncbi:hypothetical protein C0J52_25601 [Blattella germanica]|nr:hypothetical protein C0J52_25601 [Blattella germanica]
MPDAFPPSLVEVQDVVQREGGPKVTHHRVLAMLNHEELVEIILLCGCSQRDVAAEFNRRHPEREPVSYSSVGRLLDKFKSTGSVQDASRSGRPSTSAETEEMILAKVAASPKKSTRRRNCELAVPYSTIQLVLKKHKFHPYKLQL